MELVFFDEGVYCNMHIEVCSRGPLRALVN